ncbi:MAG: hypothetical protein KC777_08135 [Cyanobacteria bacterium HKST-UBA02]|nr:hypothetical protein [Cyanobacteria bacterium HKST-UBA02]
MRIEMVDPLTTPAKIRVTYNDKELFTRDFAAGETPVLEFETPKQSGNARAVLLLGDKEIPLGMASYIFDDVLGAGMLKDAARELARGKDGRGARKKLRQAIVLLEKLAPDSEDMADAYLQMSFLDFFARCRKANKPRRQQQALAWYEKAIAVWERNGNAESLRANLTNVSAMYGRAGLNKEALTRAERALKMAQATASSEPESISAWTHAAGRNLEIGKLDRAERIVKDGLKRFGENTPDCAYLWNLRSQIYEARARRFREKAESILPPDACPI